MGVVYEARDPALDRPLALKLLPPYLSADPAAVRRLTAEARAASALDHPHIETVYEIGETSDGRVFIAMAYYDGETLRERIARGPMPVSEVIELAVQLGEGLSAAHRSRIVHCDIKPENLLVTRDGVLKIVDFGIAKVVADGPMSVGTKLGTAAYMSPEQARGGEVDQRTDTWSMGVVLYELLAGVRPFRGEGEALVQAICHAAPQPLSDIRRDLPPALVTIVERCLQKEPGRRFESTDALTRELRVASGDAAAIGAAGRRLPRVLLPYVLAFSLLLGLAGLYALFSDRDRALSPPDARAETALPGIAVLPFEVKGAGLDIWGDGMVDLLSANLDGVAGLRAIDSRTVLARWRQAVQEAGAPDLERRSR